MTKNNTRQERTQRAVDTSVSFEEEGAKLTKKV